MELLSYLKNNSQKRLITIAKEHQIYHNPQFSKLWLSNQIKDKLSNTDYLNKIIEEKLSRKTIKFLKKLISIEPINKDSITPEIFIELIDNGLIYEKNNFCYLPCDLKKNLKKILSFEEISIPKKKKKKIIKKAPASNIKINHQTELFFFTYLILSLNRIIKSSKKELLNYIKEINSSSIADEKLVNYILNYSYHHQLLDSEHLQLTKSFYKWLNKSYSQRVINSLEFFTPQYSTDLRKIIAVLSHCPLNERLPLKFIYNEFNHHPFDTKIKEILTLLNILKFKEGYLMLTPFCWKLFNPNFKFKFSSPQKVNQRIIIKQDCKLSELWKITQGNKLVEIV